MTSFLDENTYYVISAIPEEQHIFSLQNGHDALKPGEGNG
jgi:hypothetical protein